MRGMKTKLCLMLSVALCTILPYISENAGMMQDAVPAFAENASAFTVESVSPPLQAEIAFTVEVVRQQAIVQAEPKRILIYHTHTWEAYTQSAEKQYKETEKWRTKDNAHNVTTVGEALTHALEAMGYVVVHDDTAFEPPDLSTAYARSLTMLEKRAADGELYDLYIDLHRDAYDSPNAIRRTVNIGGTEVARFMVLVGKGTGQTGAGYEIKPEWEKNYAIAERITNALNVQADQLARSICVKSGRFNQHIAPCCVLIECGSNHNTLQQVLDGVPYLAKAIDAALAGE